MVSVTITMPLRQGRLRVNYNYYNSPKVLGAEAFGTGFASALKRISSATPILDLQQWSQCQVAARALIGLQYTVKKKLCCCSWRQDVEVGRDVLLLSIFTDFTEVSQVVNDEFGSEPFCGLLLCEKAGSLPSLFQTVLCLKWLSHFTFLFKEIWTNLKAAKAMATSKSTS